MAKECSLRAELGFDVELLTNDNYQKYCPFEIESGILSSSSSSLIDPYLFTIDLLNICNLNGVDIYEKTKLKNSINADKGIKCTTLNNFEIKANKLLICTGYRAFSLFKEPISTFSRSFNIVTSPLNVDSTIWYKNMIMRNNEEYYTYIRTTQDNRIIIGGEDITQLAYDENKVENAYSNLECKLRKLFPNINNYTIDFKFNGLFANTTDGLPYIGEHPDFKDHYFCLGYGSNGILYSTLGAQMIAKLYKGESDPDLELFKFRR